MKKTKTGKGITLVALIITIVVLLILAVVAITAIQNDGILAHANNAASKYNQKQDEENDILNVYENHINNYLGNGGSGDDEVPTVTPKVGQYVEYDVSYDDMYNSTKTFGKTDGWRYLGTESGTGNHLLISTAIPMKLYCHDNVEGGSAKWWDTTQKNANAKVTQGMLKNFDKIPFAQKSSGTGMGSGEENTAIGNFAPSKRTYNKAEYDAVGDYFKVTGKTYSNSITIRTLTLEELNRAVNSANAGVEGYTQREETSTVAGFKDIPEGNTAYGLFDLSDIGLSNNYYYWLASPYLYNGSVVYGVCFRNSHIGDTMYLIDGVRPVVVLTSDIQFTDADNNTVLEIKE